MMTHIPFPQPYPQIQQQPRQAQSVVRVTGENGARAYPLPPDSSVLMMDELAPIVWLKTTDSAGYPPLQPYNITPYKAMKPQWSKMYQDMAAAELTHAGFLRTMAEEMINSLSWVPEDDWEAWENCVAKSEEKEAVVRLMLSK